MKGFLKATACSVLALAVATSTLFGCSTANPGNTSSNTPQGESELVTYKLQSCHEESAVATLSVNGEKVPVVKFMEYDYAQFSFGGTAQLEVTINEDIETFSVSPLAKNIEAKADGKKLTFSITESIYMIVKINGIKEIVIIADELETDIPASSGDGIYNIVTDYNADKTGVTSVVEPLQKAVDDANKAGGGIVYVPEGLYKLDGNIMLRSNVHLYLEGGSVIRSVKERANYTIHSYKSSLSKDVTWTFLNEVGSDNIKIYGRGMIDGYGHDMLTGEAQLLATLFYFRQGTNIKMDGIMIRDGNFWTVEPKLCRNCEFTNLKVLNGFADMTENDAIDICESKDVLVKHMMAISEDDTYSTKTYTAKGILEGETSVYEDLTLENVTFDDCFGWTHCGTFKVGDGSNAPHINVVFKNSYSYKCMQAIKVSHAYGSSEYKDIVFDNIDIEGYGGRVASDRRWLLIDTFSGTTEDPGNIEGLTIKNINIRDLGSQHSTMKGRDGIAFVKGVVFENIKVPGQEEYASSLEEMNIYDINSYGTSDYKILPEDNSGKFDASDSLTYASGVTVTASSTESGSYPAAKAIDSDDNTRWASGASDNQWITVDFGKEVSFNRIRIIWEAAHGKEYKLQISNDNTTWTDLVHETNGTAGTFEYDVSGKGRYLRMLGIKRGDDKNGYSIYEIQAFNRDNYDAAAVSSLKVAVRLSKRDYTESVLKQYTSDSTEAYKNALKAAQGFINSNNTAGATDILKALKDAEKGLVQRGKPSDNNNLALNKNVIVSGTQNDTSDAQNAVDGKGGSCWRSQTGEGPYFITVDLGTKRNFDIVAFNWEDTYATSYKVSISDDNENWTNVTIDGNAYFSAGKKGEQILYLDKTYNARYVKMTCFAKAAEWGVGIYEFEIFDTASLKDSEPGTDPIPDSEPKPDDNPVKQDGNLALNKTATAKTQKYPRVASLIVDGKTDADSRWARGDDTPTSQDQWIMVDLGELYTINNVVIKWENNPADYSIEVSKNGTDWTTVRTDKAPSLIDFTTDDGLAKNYTSDSFDDADARYVRINITPTDGGNGKYWLSVFELEVYLK